MEWSSPRDSVGGVSWKRWRGGLCSALFSEEEEEVACACWGSPRQYIKEHGGGVRAREKQGLKDTARVQAQQKAPLFAACLDLESRDILGTPTRPELVVDDVGVGGGVARRRNKKDDEPREAEESGGATKGDPLGQAGTTAIAARRVSLWCEFSLSVPFMGSDYWLQYYCVPKF